MRDILVSIFCFIFIALFIQRIESVKRPDYIPAKYLPIKENDFNTYLEWYNYSKDSTREIWISDYNAAYKTVESKLPAHWNNSKYCQVYPIHNETRYFLINSLENLEDQENYGLAISGKEQYITMKSESENPQIYKQAFLCRQWWIINQTHALDTLKLYKKLNGKFYSIYLEKPYVILNESLVQEIKSISNEDCFRDEIVKMLEKCFNTSQHCTMNYENKKPNLVISDEHVIEDSNGAQIIMRTYNKNDIVNVAYYVLKYDGHYYYFPDDLKTANVGDYKKRVSLLPILINSRDLFWKRVKSENTTGEPSLDSISIQIDHSNIYINNLIINIGRLIGLH